jgi:hypothetical protein
MSPVRVSGTPLLRLLAAGHRGAFSLEAGLASAASVGKSGVG